RLRGHLGAAPLAELGDGLLDLLLGLPLPEEVEAEHQALPAEQVARRVGRLGALLEPVEDALVVEPHDGGLGDGLVAPEVFDEPAVARAARFGGEEGVDGVLLAPHPAEAEFDGHCGVVLGFGLWVSGSRTRNQKREATAAYRPPRRLWRSTLRPFPVRRVIVRSEERRVGKGGRPARIHTE